MADGALLQSGEGRRKVERDRCFKFSHVVFDGGRSSADCVVRDVSDGGARLVFEETLGVPSAFVLVDSHGNEHGCLVRWRSDYALGVEFCDDTTAIANDDEPGLLHGHSDR